MTKTDIGQLKILSCSINAWNSKVGDNTFPLLLGGFDPQNVASLFIREDAPDSKVCDNYFRISESKVIKSVIKRNERTGQRVERSAQSDLELIEQHNELYSKKQRLYYTKLFARELFWMLGKWKTAELDGFIDGFAPDVVIYEMSRYAHLNRLIRYVIKKTGAKGIGCFWDDTFTYKQKKSLGYKAFRFFQRASLKKLAAVTDQFFAITPKTKREADEVFGIDCTVLTKPVEEKTERIAKNPSAPLKMLYTGNLNIGRDRTVLSVIDALKTVNKDEVKIVFDVYTNTVLDANIARLFETEFSVLHPPVTQKEVLELQRDADILVFAEALDSKEKVARLSFSTKITDYYAAGKCIFAVGDSDLAPIELFVEEDTAIVATATEQILPCLNRLSDGAVIEKYAQSAFEIGQEKYSKQKILSTFNEVLLKTQRS